MRTNPRRWSKSDCDHAFTLAAAEVSNSLPKFREQATALDLTGESTRSNDIFLLLFGVTVAASKFGRSRTASRDSEFWEGLIDLQDAELVNTALVRRIHRMAIDPLGNRARGGLLPGPPETLADMYTVCMCCNFAVEDSIARTWHPSSWERRIRLLMTGIRLRRIAIPDAYPTGTY